MGSLANESLKGTTEKGRAVLKLGAITTAVVIGCWRPINKSKRVASRFKDKLMIQSSWLRADMTRSFLISCPNL